MDMIFEKVPSGAGLFNSWTVNGKEYPHDKEFVIKQGSRNRLVFRNRSEDDHPLHMHRHSFEIVEINGKAAAGIMKDNVIVPGYGRAYHSGDLRRISPGLDPISIAISSSTWTMGSRRYFVTPGCQHAMASMICGALRSGAPVLILGHRMKVISPADYPGLPWLARRF